MYKNKKYNKASKCLNHVRSKARLESDRSQARCSGPLPGGTKINRSLFLDGTICEARGASPVCSGAKQKTAVINAY